MSRRIAGLGWNPDRPDPRDFKFVRPPTAARVQVTPDWSEGMLAAFNQGNAGTCTGNAFARQICFNQKRQGEPIVMPSRLFSYYVARAREGVADFDAGAQLRDVLAGGITDGICPESVWGYGDTPAAVTMRPPAAAFLWAQRCEVFDYQRVDNTNLADLTAALTQGPLIGGVTLFDSFESAEVTRTGLAPMPGTDSAVIGGHALWFYQLDLAARLVRFTNSWGPGWGQRGNGAFPLDYILDGDLAADFWLVTRIT